MLLLALLLAPAQTPLPPSAPVTQQGVTVIAYDVGVDGNVTHCSIFQASGAPELDNRACSIFTEKARFKPKLDSYGRAIPELNRRFRIAWKIKD